MTGIPEPGAHARIVVFTGAGMSAESGVPTYRGRGGTWARYHYEEVACQRAFERDPAGMLDSHEVRRAAVLACAPHAGHDCLVALERRHPAVTIVTQNIDGMHQRAGSRDVVELHGSLWRVRCACGERELPGPRYAPRICADCGRWWRPAITWFEDLLDPGVLAAADAAIRACTLFVSVGTSGVVWPAAGFPQVARDAGATLVEVNPEPSEFSHLYDRVLRAPASLALPALFPRGAG